MAALVDQLNMVKHDTTVVEQIRNAAKRPDGSRDTISILNGNHDLLAKKQHYIIKKCYLGDEYNNLEPLKRRKLCIAQKADEGLQKPPVYSVAVVSVDNTSEIAALTYVVSTSQTSVNDVIGVSTR